jgi:hypothetical protein
MSMAENRVVANSNVESAHPEWNTPDNPDRSPKKFGMAVDYPRCAGAVVARGY